nr:MAG TPA: hypothetical protein [Caudoviricetes sp.]
MAKKKPYNRKRLRQRINGLTEILQYGVSAGDLPEISVSHVLYTLSNFELRLAELPPLNLEAPTKGASKTEQETTS